MGMINQLIKSGEAYLKNQFIEDSAYSVIIIGST